MKPIARLFALAVIFLSFIAPCRNAPAQEKQEFVRKDEIFFLQEDIQQLKTKVFAQESLLEKTLAEKESLRVSWAIAQAQGEVLQGRVDKLQKDLFDKERAALSDAAAAIASAQAEAKRFEQELNLNRMVVEKKDERIAELVAAHESLMREMRALIAEKDKLRAEVVRVSRETDGFKSGLEARLANEKAVSQKRLDDALRDADQARARIMALEADLPGRINQVKAPFRAQVKSLQVELGQARQSAREAEDKLLALEKESARLNKIDHEKTLKVSALEKERDTLSRDFFALQGKRIALEKRIVDVQAKAKEDAGLLVQQIGSFEGKLAKLNAESDQVKIELKQASTEAEVKAAALAARNEEYRLLEGRLAELQVVKASAEKRLAEAEEDLKAVNASLPVKIAEAKKALEEKLDVLNAAVESSAAQLKDKEVAVKQLSSERDGALAQLKDAEIKVQALSADLEYSKTELKKIEASVPEKLAVVEKAAEERIAEAKKALEEKLDVLNAAVESSAAQLKDKEVAVKQLSSERDGALAQLKDAEIKVQASEAKVKEAVESLKKVKTEAELKAAALAARNEEYRLLEGRLAELQAGKVSVEKSLAAAEEGLKAVNASLSVKIAEAKKPLEEKVSAQDVQTASLVALLKDKTAEAKALLSDRDMVLAQLKKAEDKVRALSADLEHSKAELKKIEAAVPEKLAVFEQASETKVKEAVESLKKVKTEAEVKAAALAARNEEYRLLQSRLAAVEAVSLSTEKALAEAKKPLEEQIAALSAQNKELGASISGRVAETRKSLEERINMLNAQAGSLAAQLKDKDMAEKQVSLERDAFASQLRNAEDRIQALSKELDQAKTEFKQVEAAVPEKLAIVKQAAEARIAQALKPLEEKIAALNARNKELDAIANQLSSDREADVQAKEAERVAWKDQYRALQEELALKNTALRQKEVACASLEAHVKDLQKKIAAVQGDLAKKEDDLAETEKSGTSLWAEYQELQSQLAIARKALSALRSKKEMKAQAVDALKEAPQRVMGPVK